MELQQLSLWDALGRPLDVEDRQTLPTLGGALQAGVGVLAGLAHLHPRSPRQVLHRDLKSLDVLLDAGGRVLLADFGDPELRLSSVSAM